LGHAVAHGAQTPLLDREGVAPPAIKVEVENTSPAKAEVA
jgi:hypothetical protein